MTDQEPAAEWVPVAHLKGWKDNPRDNDHVVPALMESIERFGFAAPIVARKEDGMIVAGHTRLKAALELRMTEVPVRWMDLTEAEARMLALADNKLAELAAWDEELLTKAIEELLDEGHDVEGLGFSEDEIRDIMGADAEIEEVYTAKVEAPIYEIRGDRPDESELYDQTKANNLAEQIASADIDDNSKQFLMAAAQRHTVFQYDKIAEYYAHASAPVQRLMEDSALVIIDFDRAIELGFVKLTEDIAAAYRADHG